MAGLGEARRAVAPLSVPSAEDPPLHCCVPHLPSAFRPVCPSPNLPPSAARRARACLFSILAAGLGGERGLGGGGGGGMRAQGHGQVEQENQKHGQVKQGQNSRDGAAQQQQRGET